VHEASVGLFLHMTTAADARLTSPSLVNTSQYGTIEPLYCIIALELVYEMHSAPASFKRMVVFKLKYFQVSV
jgi:hypothetical protein